MREFNKAMSAVRVSVDCMFGKITKYFSFMDFRDRSLFMARVGAEENMVG
jgi:hypothetical protein